MEKSLAQNYLPYKIYINTQDFLKSRKLQLLNAKILNAKYPVDLNKSDPEYYSAEEFLKNIQYLGYVIVLAKDDTTKTRRYDRKISEKVRSLPIITFIAVLDLETELLDKSESLHDLLRKIPEYDNDESQFNLDIIIVSHNDISKKVQKSINEKWNHDGTDSRGFVHITHLKYSILSTRLLESKHIPKHEIIPPDMEREILDGLYLEKINLPKILSRDPIALWLGAEPGDIIEITNFSEETILEVKYRVVRHS